MFDEFLNIPSCDDIPDVAMWRERFEQEFLPNILPYNKATAALNAAVR